MAIPTEPPVEETNSIEIAEPKIAVNDGDAIETLGGNNEPVQIAMAGKAGNKASGIVTDAANEIIEKYQNKTADAIQSPNTKKRVEDANKEIGTITDVDQGPDVARVTESGDIIVRAATPEEMSKLQKLALEADSFEVKSPNLKNIDAGMLAIGDTDGALKALIKATYESYKNIQTASGQRIIRSGERGFEKIIEDANRIGSVDAFLMLMNRTPGDRLLNDAELLAARRTIVSLQLETTRLINRAKKTGDPLDKAKAAQAISLEGYASIQLIGVQEDYARGLASNRIIAAPSRARVDQMAGFMENSAVVNQKTSAVLNITNLDTFINEYGGMNKIDELLYFYERLPNDRTKHEFARRSVTRTYLLDPLVEIYQSALLSNPITHAYNLAGQIVMTELQVLERVMEGRPLEALMMLKAQGHYFGQAMKAGWHALKHESSLTENVSKFDTQGKAISANAFGLSKGKAGLGGKAESAAAYAIDGFGISMRALGYRPMIAMDESFKVIARGMQMEALAFRAKADAEKAAKLNNMSDEDVTRHGQAAYLKTLHSESTFKEASEFARMVTFQDDLPPLLSKASGIVNHPILKIWLPFYKTPTNIVRRIIERTPLQVPLDLLKFGKSTLINGSAAEKKAMMAKITTGTMIGGTAMYLASGGYGDDVIFTGYGPRKKKERANWLETHEPYSIGVKGPNGGYKWISYARYDPISGILALAADTKYVVQNQDDPQINEDLVINLGLSITDYVGTALPMVQFIGQLIELNGSPYADQDSKVERITELLSKQVVSAGLVIKEQVTTMGTYGLGMKSTVERIESPIASETKPGDIEEIYPNIPGMSTLTPAMRGSYEALTAACAKTPGCSDDLPPKTNRWGEPIVQTEGRWWNYFVPTRVISKPQKNIVNKELELLMTGLPPLSRTMNEAGVRLTGPAYDAYKKYYNNPASSNAAKAVFVKNIVGDHNMPPPILEAYAILFKSEDYKTMINDAGKRVPANRKHRLNKIKLLDSKYKSYAKQLMYYDHPEYKALVDKRNAFADEWGENPQNLKLPTEGEIERAKTINREKLLTITE